MVTIVVTDEDVAAKEYVAKFHLPMESMFGEPNGDCVIC
jgi:hypothetical protein